MVHVFLLYTFIVLTQGHQSKTAEGGPRKRIKTEYDGHHQREESTHPPRVNSLHYVKQVNDIVFRLLYRAPADFSRSSLGKPPAEVLRDVARLAVGYDCIASTRDQMVAAIYTAPEFGIGAIQAKPCLFLEVAAILENEGIFIDVLRRIAGRRIVLKDQIHAMPPNLVQLVNDYSETLNQTVERCVAHYHKPRHLTTSPLSLLGPYFTDISQPTSSSTTKATQRYTNRLHS